jgi:hypothetical protein
MGICVFKTKDVLPAFKHAIRGKEHEMGFEATEAPAPGLMLVHDQGVYIMSNSKEEEGHVVAYAKGCNPERDEFFYEESARLVGGDDFGEVVISFNTPKRQEEFLERLLKFEEFIIKVTPRKFDMSFRKQEIVVGERKGKK